VISNLEESSDAASRGERDSLSLISFERKIRKERTEQKERFSRTEDERGLIH
jgi:hypothetical protein